MNESGQPTPDPENKLATSEDRRQTGKSAGRNKKGLFVVIFFLIAFIIINRHEPVDTIDCTPEIISTKPDVIMLGAWWCTYCYQAKRYFQNNNIHYCEYDMESTAIGKRMYEESGSGAIPVLLIGQHRLKGFDERQIDSALSLLNQ